MSTLERQKADLTLRVAAGKQKLVDLEDEILRLLSEAEGSLLENETLVDTLQQSKLTSDEVTRQLNEAEETEIKIDPMYQFSLDAYVDLFNQSMDKSRTSPKNITGT